MNVSELINSLIEIKTKTKCGDMPVWLEVSRYGGDENDQDISEMDELTYSPIITKRYTGEKIVLLSCS